MAQLITIKGDLNDDEKEIVNARLESSFPKIVKKSGAITGFEIVIKKYHKEGRATHYSIKTDLRINSRQIETNAEDWDLKRVMHDVLDKLLTRLEDEFHVKERKTAVKSKISKMPKQAEEEIDNNIKEVGDKTDESFYIKWRA